MILPMERVTVRWVSMTLLTAEAAFRFASACCSSNFFLPTSLLVWLRSARPSIFSPGLMVSLMPSVSSLISVSRFLTPSSRFSVSPVRISRSKLKFFFLPFFPRKVFSTACIISLMLVTTGAKLTRPLLSFSTALAKAVTCSVPSVALTFIS